MRLPDPDRLTSPARGWGLVVVALVILVGSLTASPDRILPLPFVGAGLLLAWLPSAPLRWWLVAMPLLVLVNLPQLRTALAGGLYPSEALMLGGFIGLLGRSNLAPQGAGRVGGWRRDMRRAEASGDPLAGWCMVAFAGWMALAAILLLDRIAPAELWRMLRLAFLGWAAFALGQRGGCRGGQALVVSTSLVLLVLGALTVFEALRQGGGELPPAVGELVGGSELLAIHLTLLWPLALALAVAGPGGARRRALGWLATLLGAAALLISFSRSGWIGGWLATLVVLGVIWGARRQRTVGWLLALGVMVSVAVGALLRGWLPMPGLPEVYLERLASLGGPELFGARAHDWQRGIAAILRSPLLGDPAGPNCYNLFLQLAVASGIAVLLPFLLLLVAVARAIARAVGGADAGWVAAGCAGALVGLLVTGVGESSLGTRVMPLAMVIAGLATSLGCRSVTESKAPSAGEDRTSAGCASKEVRACR